MYHTRAVSCTKLQPSELFVTRNQCNEERHTSLDRIGKQKTFMTYVQFHTIPSLGQGKKKERENNIVKERTQAKLIKKSEEALLPTPSTEPSATELPVIVGAR